jgi:predicted HAD superfamily Cof-like phosphohydrolase
MDNNQKYVTRFHKKHGGPTPDYPVALSGSEFKLRYGHMAEELREYLDAFIDGDYFEQIDALVDLLYVTYGTAVAMGVDIEPFFQAVHKSNMTKTGEQRADGKILKGDAYVAPDIQGVYERMYEFLDDDGAADDLVFVVVQ